MGVRGKLDLSRSPRLRRGLIAVGAIVVGGLLALAVLFGIVKVRDSYSRLTVDYTFGRSTVQEVVVQPVSLADAPPSAELVEATNAYLADHGPTLEAFIRITDDLANPDLAALGEGAIGCRSVATRLEETIDLGALLAETVAIPDSVLVDLYASTQAARLDALRACFDGDTVQMATEMAEASRLSELIAGRLGGGGTGS